MTASPTDAGAGMPSEDYASRAYCLPSEEAIARAMAAADSGPEGSALFAIHWEEFGPGYLNSARAILALIRPAFEAKEREITELKRIERQTFSDAAAVNVRADALEAKLAEKEREIERANELLKGDELLERCVKSAMLIDQLNVEFDAMKSRAFSAEAKLAQAVADEREACALVAEDKAHTLDFRARAAIARAIRARSAPARGENHAGE
jgi:hypothetical protein